MLPAERPQQRIADRDFPSPHNLGVDAHIDVAESAPKGGDNVEITLAPSPRITRENAIRGKRVADVLLKKKQGGKRPPCRPSQAPSVLNEQGAWRRQAADRTEARQAAGCQAGLPVAGRARPRSSDLPRCWDSRSRVSLWWCDARPRGHDGEHAGATAALPMSPPVPEPYPGPPGVFRDIAIAACRVHRGIRPADWTAARRGRGPPED
jgi:hypothetical protein